MKNLKMLGLAALSAIALMAFADTASATTLEVGGATKNSSVALTASLASGETSTIKNTSGSVQNTCTVSHAAGATTSPYTGTHVNGLLSELSFSGCARRVTVHAPGSLTVTHNIGTTNGRVSSLGATITVEILLWANPTYVTCRTHEKPHIGSLTGTSSGHATLHIAAVLDCGFFLPSAKWEATYTVTAPTGLGVSS